MVPKEGLFFMTYYIHTFLPENINLCLSTYYMAMTDRDRQNMCFLHFYETKGEIIKQGIIRLSYIDVACR